MAQPLSRARLSYGHAAPLREGLAFERLPSAAPLNARLPRCSCGLGVNAAEQPRLPGAPVGVAEACDVTEAQGGRKPVIPCGYQARP